MDSEIFGCFVSIDSKGYDQRSIDLAQEQSALFRSYIWGEKGIAGRLKSLDRSAYGSDLCLVLFQFNVNPSTETKLREIENYRKKEKSIGIPVVVNEENFFSKPEEERLRFLRKALLDKMKFLEKVVKRNKLDTRMDQLKSDLERILS